MHFRRVKDLLALPLHRVATAPPLVTQAALGIASAVAWAVYGLPGSPVRRTVQNFARATGRDDAARIYAGMVRNIRRAGLHFAALNRGGRARLVTDTIIDPSLATQYGRWDNGKDGLIFLVPHCAGAVLSSAGLSTFCPTVLMVREPRQPRRQELMLDYLRKLGPEYILARNTPPTTVTRNMIRCLRSRKVIVGTTDTIQPAPDAVETWAFGQRIYSPSWPAKISGRLGLPIVPGFIHMEGSKIRLIAGEGYVEPDVGKCTQRWVSSFEGWFRQYPSDWVFMLDKRWGRVLAAAASGDSSGPLESAPARSEAATS